MIGHKKIRITKDFTLLELLVTQRNPHTQSNSTKSQPPLRIIGDLKEREKELLMRIVISGVFTKTEQQQLRFSSIIARLTEDQISFWDVAPVHLPIHVWVVWVSVSLTFSKYKF